MGRDNGERDGGGEGAGGGNQKHKHSVVDPCFGRRAHPKPSRRLLNPRGAGGIGLDRCALEDFENLHFGTDLFGPFLI